MADRVAEAMVAAAQGLLDGLTPAQRAQACWEFPADGERRLWFYTPTDHGGLALADMDSGQHRLVHRLVASGLSEPGYVTAALILGQENILDHLEGFGVDFERPRGRDPQLYWVAVFGQPTVDGSWAWRFGGHHLSLNFTLGDGRVRSATPCFMGADPAASPLLGPHLHRPLGGAEDLGRELARALTSQQADGAVVAPAPPTDIVTSNRTVISEGDRPLALPEIWRGRFERGLDRMLASAEAATATSLGLTEDHVDAVAFSNRPRGIAASQLDRDQREILRALLATYIGRIHDDLADRQAARLDDAGLDRLSFLWAGGLEVGDPHYYRIQGGDLLIEYDNAQRGGNHIHTVWRDLSNDFGGDPLARHYAEGHRH